MFVLTQCLKKCRERENEERRRILLSVFFSQPHLLLFHSWESDERRAAERGTRVERKRREDKMKQVGRRGGMSKKEKDKGVDERECFNSFQLQSLHLSPP